MYYKTKRKTTNTTINFILLAYFIPLLCSILLLNIPIFKTGIGNLLLFAIQGASPSLAALLSVYIGENKTGITTFLYKKYIENFSIYYCLLAFFTPALILTISKLVINAVMGYSWSISLPSKRKIIIILWALIAEELGWRGFLQEKFEVKFGKHLTPLLVGTIWALWHYHFFIIG